MKIDAPINILLAEDDLDDRKLFEQALKEIPIATNLTTIIDGEKLMDYLFKPSTQLPDILFLDLSMPRKTGFECLTEIKEDDKLKAIPVIVLTTSFTRGIDFEANLRNTLCEIGAQDYLRKPYSFQELKQVIHQTLIKLIEKARVAG